ncbi:MAG: hypothetical protein QNJ77_03260 [Acidimicrobiia bacterium]|nr:hypothetical protein [Acidimicrobiia bacterium]
MNVQPRFEFRVWGVELDDPAARLRSNADRGETVTSSEIYLVASGADDTNTKLRAGVLDIKVLSTVERRCERWAPWIKAGFPLAAVKLTEILPRLGVPDASLERDSYLLSEFLAEIVDPHPELRSVDVSKHRRKYAIGGCLAEYADVAFDGVPLETVAVESADLDALVATIRLLGIEREENVSYPRAIKMALG